MLQYNKHNITNSDIRSVVKTLKSDYLTKGPKVLEFEKNLKNYFGSKYCLTISNATCALLMISKLLKLNKKDIVILSPLTFISGANSASFFGAKTLFVDINEYDQNIDCLKLEKILKNKNIKKKVKAIIVTDYGGNPADWKKLKKISKTNNIPLINDNCHAIGSSYKGRKDYATKYADFVIHSYHAVKNITCGEGGAIFLNSKRKYKILKKLREHGFNEKNNYKSWKYDMEILGFNFRLSDINCALGNSQLSRLNKIVKIRNNIAKKYINLFKKFNAISFPNVKSGNINAYHLFPIRINFKKLKINKNNFLKKMKMKYRINLQIHYTPTYRFKYYTRNYNIKFNHYPNSEKFFSESVSLPIYLSLTEKKQKYVVSSIVKCLKLK